MVLQLTTIPTALEWQFFTQLLDRDDDVLLVTGKALPFALKKVEIRARCFVKESELKKLLTHPKHWVPITDEHWFDLVTQNKLIVW